MELILTVSKNSCRPAPKMQHLSLRNSSTGFPSFALDICRYNKAFKICGSFASVHVSVLRNRVQCGALVGSTYRVVLQTYQLR